MKISVGQVVPRGEVTVSDAGGMRIVDLHSLLAKKKVVLFGVPGAFTKNCSNTHFQGFVINEPDFYARGVDLIACIAVNDTNVMAAWKKTFPENKILMISDADASYIRSVGLDIDEGIEAGIRCSRFAAMINNLTVEGFWIDSSGVNHSSAEAVLNHIDLPGRSN